MRIYLVNIGALLLILVTTAILDSQLALGNLHGVVFQLYTFYGSICLLIFNLLISTIYLYKQQKQIAKQIAISAVIVCLFGILLAITPSYLR